MSHASVARGGHRRGRGVPPARLVAARGAARLGRAVGLAGALLLGSLLPAGPAGAGAIAVTVPPGYEISQQQRIAAGVEHLTFTASGDEQVVNVAWIAAGSPVALRTVLAGNQLGEPLERTSSMCERTNCLVAVNGDFFDNATPAGGLMAGGEILRSPAGNTPHLLLGGSPAAAGPLRWSGRLLATDFTEVRIHGINTRRATDQVVLYTPRFGDTTRTNEHGLEIIFEVTRPEGGPVRAGQTTVLRSLERHEGGDAPIPENGVVLSGHGAGRAALDRLARRIEGGAAGRETLLRLEVEGGRREVLGGNPVLLRDGTVVAGLEPRSFAAHSHPRTVVGWNDRGEAWLVTVDGREPGRARGMSLPEAARMMRSLGATDAINLEGGRASTFVVRGRVANRPSDRLVARDARTAIVAAPGEGDRILGDVEHPVASALVLVTREAGDAAAGEGEWMTGSAPEGPVTGSAGLPLRLRPSGPDDPAGVPTGDLSPIAPLAGSGEPAAGRPPARLLLIAALLAATAGLALRWRVRTLGGLGPSPRMGGEPGW